MSNDDIPIVKYYSKIFHYLKYISWYEFILKCKPGLRQRQKQFTFVEFWVTFNFTICFVMLILSFYLDHYYMSLGTFKLFNQSFYYWDIAFLIYSVIRLFEIVVYQVNVLLFDEERDKKRGKEYTVRSYRRLILLVIHNYIEIIIWFALVYQIFSNSFTYDSNKFNLLQIVNFSFAMMTSFGLTDIKANTNFGILITLMQSFIGLFMSLIVISRFISFLPVPKSED